MDESIKTTPGLLKTAEKIEKRKKALVRVGDLEHSYRGWSRITGISERAIWKRINEYGWEPSRAVSEPPQNAGRVQVRKDLTAYPPGRFGRLTPLHPGPDAIEKSGKRCTTWECFCKCGRWWRVRTTSLLSGASRSCGCLQRDRVQESNRTSRTPEQRAASARKAALARISSRNGLPLS